jgi:hypothetical protein
MTTPNTERANAAGLPPSMRTAQAAIDLPEVQDLLRRLSAYNLGIFMPHMHDERTGQFQPLPEDAMQVESGLEVSFQPTADIAPQKDRFLPVAWLWRAGAATPAAACEMVWDEGQSHAERPAKHKMSKRIQKVE